MWHFARLCDFLAIVWGAAICFANTPRKFRNSPMPAAYGSYFGGVCRMCLRHGWACVANVYVICGVQKKKGRAYWRAPIARPMRGVSLAIAALKKVDRWHE